MSTPKLELDHMQRKAFRFALRLKPAQEKSLQRWSGQLRWIWNQALARQRKNHEAGEKYSSYVDMAEWLKEWRTDPATAWLREAPFHCEQQVLRKLDESYKRFFDACKKGSSNGRRVGPPRFKKRGDKPSLRYPDAKQIKLDAGNARIQLPKVGWVRMRLSREMMGTVKNATVSKEGNCWFVAIQTETGCVAPAAGLVPTLGIDMGLNAFIANSEGEITQPLKAMERQAKRLRRYQKSVSRKKKGSCNRRKAVQKLATLHRRIAHQRSDWVHKLTTELAGRHAVIVIEDLKIISMSASAKGTIEAPGRRVAQKAGLNGKILDAAWGLFKEQLQYKLAATGGELIKINPAYTSQRCSCCGFVHKDNRKTQEQFLCLACGHAENADANAAKNILAAGLAVMLERNKPLASEACGETVSRAKPVRAKRAISTKQEPAEEVSCP